MVMANRVERTWFYKVKEILLNKNGPKLLAACLMTSYFEISINVLNLLSLEPFLKPPA